MNIQRAKAIFKLHSFYILVYYWVLFYFFANEMNCILLMGDAGSECNSSKLTFDGVDVMGERLAEEVRDRMMFFFQVSIDVH